ncbi:MAG: calcium-binding protein, partial [Alphaproteobacteria bacterium]|nr:calcium-binding protein [Alphaproteobacteria bacterium]
TMTVAQNQAFTGTISTSGTTIINLSDAGTITALANVSKYIMANGTNSITMADAAQNVDGNSGADTVIVGALATTGILNGGAGTSDVVSIGGTVGSGTIANFETLTLTASSDITAANSGASLGASTTTLTMTASTTLTMTDAQNDGLNGSATVVGVSQQVTLTDIASTTGIAGIETYVLGNFTNSFTLAAGGQSVTGGTGVDTIFAGNGADTITGGTGSDFFSFTEGNSNAVAGGANNNATGSDTINDWNAGDQIQISGTLAGNFDVTTDVSVGTGTGAGSVGDVTVAANFVTTSYLAQTTAGGNVDIAIDVTTDGSTAAFANDAAAQAATILNVTAAAGGSTIVGGGLNDIITGAAGVDTITGAAGADTISGGGGNDIVTYTSQNESNSTAYDVLSSLTFNSATAATINTELTIAAVNTAVATGSVSAGSLVADLNTLLAVGGGVGFDTAVGGDISAALITANAGDLSGKTFLAIDADADDAFTSADYLMDVTGTTLTTVDTSTFV